MRPNISAFVFILLLFCFGILNSQTIDEGPEVPVPSAFSLQRARFSTKLLKKIKAPQDYSPFDSIDGSIRLVHYESNGDSLQGLLETINISDSKKRPGLVYLHGGFSLSNGDVQDCSPFTDEGFVVFAPSYRAENGNPGNFEFLLGEVDDAVAAIKWLQNQPYIHADSIYVFGHSLGGSISLSLSLRPNLPVRKSGSSAGVYFYENLEAWEEEDGIVPFNLLDKDEIVFRLPVYSLMHMARDHYLYIGKDDDYKVYKKYIQALHPDITSLRLIPVSGDHFSSLEPAMKLFIEEIRRP